MIDAVSMSCSALCKVPRRPTLPIRCVRHNGALVPSGSLDLGEIRRPQLCLELWQELAAACAHGSGAVFGEEFENWEDAFPEAGIA